MNFEQRIARLERQNQWYNIIVFFMLLYGINWAIISTVESAQEDVVIPLTSEAFTLVDPGGKKAAELKVTTSGPVLRMFDGRGNMRVAIGIVSSGRDYRPAIGFFNENEDLLGYVRLGRSVPHFSDPDFGTGLGDPRRLK